MKSRELICLVICGRSFGLLTGCQLPAGPAGGNTGNHFETGLQGIRNALSLQTYRQSGRSNPESGEQLIQSQVTERPDSSRFAGYQDQRIDPVIPSETGEQTRYEGRRSGPQQQYVEPVQEENSSLSRNTLRGNRRPAFYGDELAQTLPPTATERVIELTSDMSIMRQELQRLGQAIDQLKMDNSELRESKAHLSERLASLETELKRARQSEEVARTQFESLSQRIQLFNIRRQTQIAELNRIIGQLEIQLQQNDVPHGSVSPANPPQQSNPSTSSGAAGGPANPNPYRTSIGDARVNR